MKRVFAVFLCLCLLVPIMVQPTYARDGMDLRETYPDCLERFSTDSFEESLGRMIPYNSESLMFSIRASGASFSFTPAPVSGNTTCNAYRFVLANYTASNKMTVTYRYTGSSETYTSDCVLEQTQRTQTCLVYIPDAERVSRITVSFFGVRNGSVRLYSVNPVSAYEAIPTEYGTLSSCVANPSAGTVTLNGRVLSGVTARFTDAKLLLYRLPFGADPLTYLADETRTPLAELKIASKFTFTVPAETAGDRLSRYIVTLKTTGGTETPLTGPTYVTSLGGEAVAGGELSGGSYKGIIADETSTVISLGAGSTIVDVYLNRLLSDSQSPYSYTSGGTTIQIDRTYVAELDARIRAYTASGATVYLRYLVSADSSDGRFAVAGETDAKYKGILLSGNDSASLLYSVTDYLAERYGNQTFGMIGGIILGSGIDDAKGYNDCGELSLDAYIRNYAQAVLTARMALSKSGRGMKIVVPVTDRVSPELIGRAERDGEYDKYLLLSGLAKLFAESDFSEYTVLLESRNAPYRLAVGETGELTLVAAQSGSYTAATARDFENLLSECEMSKAGYLFVWYPPEDLTDTELIVSYLYSYHALNRSGGPGALFLCIDRERLKRLALVISRIDTEEGTGQDDFVLSVFGVNSWQELLNRQKKEHP